jgi:pimeloyl-ACP methyl ester carboxylesterase
VAALRIGRHHCGSGAAPTLKIWGDRDPVVSLAQGRAVVGEIADARLKAMPAGQVPQLGNPVWVAALLEGPP